MSLDMDATETRGGIRTGGRSERVRTSVLDATAQVLAEQGYDALRIEEVAARAGVHKTTVYRRWPSKAELVVAMVDARSAERVPVPDLGALEDDLRAFASSIVDNLMHDGGAVVARALVGAAGTAPELRAAAAAFWSRRFGLAAEMIERARARGEVAPDTMADAVIEALIGPLFVRVLLTDVPLDDSIAARTAEATTIAARAGAFRPPS
jgi:AcrR family transcriptional regulator